MMLDCHRAKHNQEDELHMTWMVCGSVRKAGDESDNHTNHTNLPYNNTSYHS